MKNMRFFGRTIITAMALVLLTVALSPNLAAAATSVFVNEIHYDNTSTDIGEAIEIAGPAGFDLTGWSIVLYNGANGLSYDTDALGGTIPDLCGGYGVVVLTYPTNGLQNGSPDGLALVDSGGTVIQFLSYEGTLVAADGPANGQTSSDIGVAEASGSAVGDSLQLGGTGTTYEDFTWNASAPNTFGVCNTGQTFSAGTIDPVINEFVFNHAGTDTAEFVEVLGGPATDYSAFTIVEIEGDGSGAGLIDDGTFTIGTTDSGGYWTTPFQNDLWENGTVSLLLVEGYTGSVNQDLDNDNDGLFDGTLPWTRIVDSVAVSDGGSSDRTYSSVVLGPFFDGAPFGAGGASRIPNGTDTDSVTDWTRNDFDGYGLPGFTGTPAVGEAENTPGATNVAITVPTDPFGACGDGLETSVHFIQGNGAISPDLGSLRTVEGVVVGDFDGPSGLGGFFLQEEDADADADPATSEGIFVFTGGFGSGVAAGDLVRVRGTVQEFFELTEIGGVTDLAICAGTGTATAATVTLPVASLSKWEEVEGMLIYIPQTLYASGNFTQGRFGEVDLSVGGPLDTPTNVVAPGAPAMALQELNDRSRIQMDDGSTVQNPLPLPPYLAADNTMRTGDTIPGLTGALGYAFGNYEVHPTGTTSFTRVNARPAVPDVGGSIRVAAYNVLNYFTTLDNGGPICGPAGNQDCRGADTASEFARQRAKLVAAISKLDADIVGLMEIENHPDDDPVADLVAGLNDAVGAGTYAYIPTGAIGTDAIRLAIIYKPATVTPVGSYAILDSSVDPTFLDTKNRPVLAQTFQENGTNDMVTVAVNHLKSKSSDCLDVGDPDTGDGQGNCNVTRTQAALALANWLATDPTGYGGGQYLITGDLNSYAMEDPITTLETAGYTDLMEHFLGSGWAAGAYSYNFFSQSGYLDHGLASPALLPRVKGAAFWHVNADEPAGLDYNNFNQPALFNADEFRSSDHDPVVVGICETTAPEVTVTASPDVLWPPKHQYVEVSAQVSVTDADPNVVISLLSVTSDEPDNGLGDGDQENDIVIVDDFTFKLRAERSGTGDGRVYTITYQVTDACGNSTIASATVNVPHSQGN